MDKERILGILRAHEPELKAAGAMSATSETFSGTSTIRS
jgi:hypothetical protein